MLEKIMVELDEIVSQIGHVKLLEVANEVFCVVYINERRQEVLSPLYYTWASAIANFARRVEEDK